MKWNICWKQPLLVRNIYPEDIFSLYCVSQSVAQWIINVFKFFNVLHCLSLFVWFLSNSLWILLLWKKCKTVWVWLSHFAHFSCREINWHHRNISKIVNITIVIVRWMFSIQCTQIIPFGVFCFYFSILGAKINLVVARRDVAVSYTHLTLPTNREV